MAAISAFHLPIDCSVRKQNLQTYVDRSKQFRLSEQLFVSFGDRDKGLLVLKQHLSQ